MSAHHDVRKGPPDEAGPVAPARRSGLGGRMRAAAAALTAPSIGVAPAVGARPDLVARIEQQARQIGVLEAASARLSRADGIESIGRAVVEETRRIIDYHNARVYVLEPPDLVVPIAFEGRVGAYDQVDLDLLRCRLGEGFTGWVAQHGESMLIGDANADPRGASIPGTDDVDESMLVVPMRYDGMTVGVITLSKLGLDQFDPDDRRLLEILADQAATALTSARNLSRSLALAAELRLLLDLGSQLTASLDSKEVANILAHHLVTALGVEDCAISYWDRPARRVVTLGYFPLTPDDQLDPFFDISGFPTTEHVLEQQVSATVDIDDPAADPAEVALLVADGKRSLVMLPIVAKGQSIGLVELISSAPIQLDPDQLALAWTIANEASMAIENARLYEVARALADRDPLTGFYNHRFLHERFGEELVRATRSRQPLSLLMLDLDDFKLINDTFGHLFGDDVLRWTAELIRSTLRASDVPARYGGDEFAILLPDSDREAAAQVAERIAAVFAATPFSGGGRTPVPVGLTIGGATFPNDGRTATELFAAADAELYRRKRERDGPVGGSGDEPDDGRPRRPRTGRSRTIGPARLLPVDPDDEALSA